METFQSLSKICSTFLSKLHCTCPEEHFGVIFLNVIIFTLNWQITWKKNVYILRERFPFRNIITTENNRHFPVQSLTSANQYWIHSNKTPRVNRNSGNIAVIESFLGIFVAYNKQMTYQFSVFLFTTKLARTKLPANASNFTCGQQVERPHTQFTRFTCSLTVKASTSRRTYANCLQPHV